MNIRTQIETFLSMRNNINSFWRILNYLTATTKKDRSASEVWLIDSRHIFV